MNDLATCRPEFLTAVRSAEVNLYEWLSPAKFAVVPGLFIFALFPDPAGRHVVKLVYKDRGSYFGKIISWSHTFCVRRGLAQENQGTKTIA
jgi:hypothetical protein